LAVKYITFAAMSRIQTAINHSDIFLTQYYTVITCSWATTHIQYTRS